MGHTDRVNELNKSEKVNKARSYTNTQDLFNSTACTTKKGQTNSANKLFEMNI